MNLRSGIVRILKPNGATAGTGFVVTECFIVTCAHVVESAGSGPGETVDLLFYDVAEKRIAHVGKKDWWRPSDAEDVTILHLEQPLPNGVKPLILGSSQEITGHGFTSFGFPQVGPYEGFPAEGVIVGKTGHSANREMIILRSQEISTGMSGAPVFDVATQRVVGMVNSLFTGDTFGRGRDSNFATPSEVLQTICPKLKPFNVIRPYRGLSAFKEDDAPFFFGRKRQVRKLIAKLRGNYRFLALIGSSGSGKSSVIQAGLFPDLRKGKGLGVGSIHIITVRPRTDPFLALHEAGMTKTGSVTDKIQHYLEILQDDTHLVLFIDQFEELFALCLKQTQQKFLSQLLDMLEIGALPVTLILSLRRDFREELRINEKWARWMDIGEVSISSMREDELEDAIQKPAQEVGLTFQEGLVERILEDIQLEDEDVIHHPLPLLEFALDQLWILRDEKGGMLTHEAYEHLDRVGGAVTYWAEREFSQLKAESQQRARRIFMRLIHYGADPKNDTRQIQTLGNLITEEDDREKIKQTVLQLADARLLTTGNSTSESEIERVEIVHEALLRLWTQLRMWRKEEREFLFWRQQLQAAMGVWKRNNRHQEYLITRGPLKAAIHWRKNKQDDINLDELHFIDASISAQKRQQWRLGMMGIAILTVITAVLFLAWSASIRADTEASRADKNAATAVFNEQLAATNAEDAIFQAKISQSRALAVSSQSIAEQDPMEAMLLAIAAGKAAETALAMDALNNQLPGMAKPLQVFNHDAHIPGARWNEAENRILSWSWDGTIRVWDADSGSQLLSLTHADSVDGAMWNEAEDRILSWSRDGTVRVWNADSGSQLLSLTHADWVDGAMWNEAEDRILSWGDDGKVRVWDADSGSQLLSLSHADLVRGALWNETENRILSWSADGTARVWDANSGGQVLSVSHGYWIEGAAYWVKGAMWNKAEDRILSWGDDGTVRIWDADSGSQVLSLSHEDSVDGALWNEAENRILSWGRDGTVRVWDADSGSQLLSPSHAEWIYGAMWSKVENLILSWGDDGTVRIWDADSGSQLLSLAHTDLISGARWNEAEDRVLSWSVDGTARVWDADSGSQLLSLSHEDSVSGAMWNEDEGSILSWGADGTVRVWDADSDSQLNSLSHEEQIVGALWNQDGNRILSWSTDDTARVWDAESGNQLLSLSHEDQIFGALWNNTENRILSWGNDGTVRVWDAESGSQLLHQTHEGWRIFGAVWNEAGNHILSWGQDGMVRVWDADSGSQLLFLSHGVAFENAVDGALWNKAEDRILSWSCDNPVGRSCNVGTVRVWDADSSRRLLSLSHADWVYGAMWNKAEDRILSWSADGTVRVWNADSGSQLLSLSHADWVSGAMWNEAENRILSWSADGTVRVWDADSGSQLLHLTHEGLVEGVLWNGAESRILSWSADGTVRVWDADSGSQLLSLSHEDSVSGATWNEAEDSILSWSRDGEARVWDAATGERLFTLNGDGSNLTIARWNRDESRILLGTRSGLVHIYYTSTAELAELACQYTTRNFTWEEWQLYFPGQPYKRICLQWSVHPSVPTEE